MTKKQTRRLTCLVALIACCFAAAPAHAANTDFNILAGGDRTGQIDLLAIGPYLSRLDVFEVVGSSRIPLRTATLNSAGDPFLLRDKVFGHAQINGLAQWRCDRRERTFIATATNALNETLTSETTGVKTPSCAKRFKVTMPTRAKPGARVTATVTDSFGLGDTKPKLCIIAPKPPKTKKRPRPRKPKTVCRTQGIRPGALTARKRIRVKTRGTWTFELRSQGQKSRTTIAVGVKRKRPKTGVPVLLLGDSLMSQLVTPIADRLEGKADVDSLVRGGGRLTSPNSIGTERLGSGSSASSRASPRRSSAAVTASRSGASSAAATPGSPHTPPTSSG